MCRVDGQEVCEAGDHRGGVRGNLGALTDERHVDVGEAATAGCDAVGGVAQEAGAVGVFPRGFAGREVATDVAFREGAVDGVAEGVDADVGVGMSGQTALVRDSDATENKGAVLDEDVDIESGADAGIHGWGEDAFEAHVVFLVGELDVVFGTGDEGDSVVDGFEDGGVVCKGGVCCSARGGAVEGEEKGEVESLGGLGAEQAFAGDRSGDLAVLSTLEGVGDREGGDGAGAVVQGCEEGLYSPGGDDGAGGVVDEDDVGIVESEGFEAEADAVLARWAAGDGREGAEAFESSGKTFGVADREYEGDFHEEGFGCPAQDGFAGNLDELFGLGGTKAGPGAGGDEEGGDTHGGCMGRGGDGVNRDAVF